MSHTNSTANYNLPQFIGSDTPAWLTDVNGAMSAIDSQMKTNADSASTANASATTANSNIGTLANLNTTAKTNLVSAVNEVNTGLGTVSGVASSASSTANSAKTAIDVLTEYLSLSTYTDVTWTCTNGSVSNQVSSVGTHSARNNSGTLGKFYGDINFTVTSSTGVTFKSSDTGFRPTSSFNIVGFATKQDVTPTATSGHDTTPLSIKFNTDGTLEFTLSAYWYNKNVLINFFNSLLFIQDFGDVEND